MYRFESAKGFLLHPCPQYEVQNEQVVISDYKIDNSKDCHLYEVGMVIPANDDYSEFKKQMDETFEPAFVEKIESKF